MATEVGGPDIDLFYNIGDMNYRNDAAEVARAGKVLFSNARNLRLLSKNPIWREEDVIVEKDVPDHYPNRPANHYSFKPELPLAPVYFDDRGVPKKAWMWYQTPQGWVLRSSAGALDLALEIIRYNQLHPEAPKS